MAFQSILIDPKAVDAALRQGKAIAGSLLALSRKLKQSPIPPSVDYEPYHDARDRKFRTARLNDSARALIWELDPTTLFIFGVAANHEEADRAARSKQCRVNAVTRELEITAACESDFLDSAPPPDLVPRVLIPHDVTDQDLKELGVPPELARIGRALIAVDALDALCRLVPSLERGLLAVQLLADGTPKEDVYRQISSIPAAPPQLEDYQSALLRSVEGRKIQVLRTEEELAKALEMPWKTWTTYLLPAQRAIAYAPRYNGPVRVTGGPGTGKTVVAVHRVRALVEQFGLFSDARRILLTTFSTTMADELKELVNSLLSSEQCNCVHVTNLDRLVRSCLTLADHPRASFKPLSEDAAIDKRIDALPGRAIVKWDTPRIRRFWDRVLLSMKERSWDEYRALRKRVRSIPSIDNGTFDKVDALAKSLENQLEADHETTFVLRLRDALELGGGVASTYTHAVVDEAQDLHALHWRFLRQCVPPGPNDIFLVADSDQRLYRAPYPMAYCDVEIANRSKRLTESYRCSQAILDFAYRILGTDRSYDPDADGALPIPKALFTGPDPVFQEAVDESTEAQRLAMRLKRWEQEGIPWPDMLVCCTRKKQQDLVRQTLFDHAIPAVVLDPNNRRNPNSVNIVTFFRAKGLEAQVAALFGVGAGALGVAQMLPEDVDRYRQALFVAATRAREELYVSWSGNPSELLKKALPSARR